MKVLVLGTCRVQIPSRKIDQVFIYPAGTTASLGQSLQAVQVMHKDIKIPHSVYRKTFTKKINYKFLENIPIDFSKIDKVILEVASIHNRYIDVDGNRIYVWKEIVPSCLTQTDDPESMIQKLHYFCSFFPDKEILFIPFPVRELRPDRQMLAKTLKKFAEKNNYNYFDPLPVIKEYGSVKCLKKSKYGICDHFSRFMIKKVREKILTFLNGN